MKEIKSNGELLEHIHATPDFENGLRTNPAAAITNEIKIVPLPLQSDKAIHRLVVISLGLVVVIAVVGGVVLAFRKNPIPEILVNMGSAAIGALAGLFAPSPLQGK
jgi:hypothetical protein